MLRNNAKTRDLCPSTLAKRKLPVQNRLGSGDYRPLENSIKVMTMKVSKGLEFPVVAVVGGEGLNAGSDNALAEDVGANVEARRNAARVLYVAATRATQQLILGSGKCVV